MDLTAYLPEIRTLIALKGIDLNEEITWGSAQIINRLLDKFEEEILLYRLFGAIIMKKPSTSEGSKPSRKQLLNRVN